MIALRIKNIRHFMNLLFTSDTFDGFTLEEAVIKTFVSYSIDGLFESGFFDGDDTMETPGFNDPYTPWALLRGSCRDLIKGKHTPEFMKFVFHGDTSPFGELPGFPNIRALLVMIRFDNTGLFVTTGTSMKEFIPDHDIDILWDKKIKTLFTGCDVDYEEQ